MRLLRGGQARRTIYLAWETGVLDVLLPELSALLYDTSSADDAGQRLWRLLDYVDRRTAENNPLDDTVLWTLLLLEPMREACEGVRDRGAAVGDFLDPIIERLASKYADRFQLLVATGDYLEQETTSASGAETLSPEGLRDLLQDVRRR